MNKTRGFLLVLLLVLPSAASAGRIDLNWRLNPEVKKEAWHYAHTGGIVDDPLWRSLQARRELDPSRFDRNHPNIAGYFVPPAVLGMQPHGPALDEMRRRYRLDSEQFKDNHRFWGRIFAMEPTSMPAGPPVISTPGDTPTPPDHPPVSGPGPQTAVPEPDSMILIGTAIAIVLASLLRRKGGAKCWKC